MIDEQLTSVKYSVTERGSFKRCRRQWDYGSLSRQALSPLVPSLALQCGTLHHKVMDNWCKAILANDSSFDPSENLDVVAAESVRKIADHYKAVVGAKMSRTELEPVFDAITFERAMIRMYSDYWGSPIQEGFILVQSEQTIVIPVCEAPCVTCDGSGRTMLSGGFSLSEDCHTCKGYGRVQLELEGTLDAIVTDNNVYYPVERKTYNARPNLDYLRHFDQGTGYAWMTSSLGLTFGGIAYDGMWRRDKVPKGKTIDELFLRTLLDRNDYELDMFYPQLVAELRDMHTAVLYPNRRWEGCYDCGYRRLCDAQTKGEDIEFIRERFYTDREKTPAYEIEA